MDIATVGRCLERHLIGRAAGLGLDPAGLRVEHVPNWGGFVNLSFRAGDGSRVRHVKVTADPDSLAGLRRWRELSGPLERRYHAPPMLDWVVLDEVGFEGPVFEHIAGRVPEPDELLPRALPVVHRLHDDRELAAWLAERLPAGTCAQVYLENHDRRFAEDLAYVEAERPAFVTPARLAWMRREAEALREAVLRSAAFEAPADSPMHGDLWEHNVLLAADAAWFLLDWDDLRPGDPALDLAMLLHAADAPESADARTSAGDGALHERLALYARAVRLDWVIDPLSDYIAAATTLAHPDAFRAGKRADHERAVARYGARYG